MAKKKKANEKAQDGVWLATQSEKKTTKKKGRK